MYKTDETTRYYHRVYGEILADDNSLPLDNNKAVGNRGPFIADAVNGSFEIVAFVTGPGRITGTKQLKITLEHSATDAEWKTLGVIYDETPSADLTLNKGDELGRCALPSTTKRYVRVCFTTTGATGKVTVIPVYLAR